MEILKFVIYIENCLYFHLSIKSISLMKMKVEPHKKINLKNNEIVPNLPYCKPLPP